MNLNNRENTKNLKFSVSMCVYGKDDPKYFQQAVESIKNQSLFPNEIVIVVDGPVTISINNILKLYEEDDVFNIIRLPKNVGHGNARRIGMENCKYDLVALMDADDISLPYRFEKQISVFDSNNEISVVGGQITEFNENPDRPISIRRVPLTDKEIKENMRFRCPMNQVTVMFKKEDVKAVGGFIDWHFEEDYYLWIRLMIAKKTLHNLDDILVNVRIGKQMYKRRGGLKYFRSEAKLQQYMLKNNIISYKVYIINILKRFVVQVLLPNKFRGWIFKKFGREEI